ncbi:MAG: MBL fold metallo-hydrolase RNA specificity domain-containing protein [Candidatus Altiarchaeota archaeon]|nr:MBL fold metallo-hydrolase RNA specificity domain-containing protein [Candidatus Altiarchaeota archaeon]
MKVTAVGGYRAIGRNMTGVSVGNDTVALDNGLRLDMLQMYDSDVTDVKRLSREDLIRLDVIPEMDRLKDVRANVISHGHLDHVGALPFTRPKAPVVSTPYAIEIGRREYREGDFYSVDYDQHYGVSRRIDVEFIRVTHSIPDTALVLLKTDEGNVVYACDYKFDDSSTLGKTDYQKIRKAGKDGVRALIVESTRIKEAGKTPPESVVKSMLDDILNSIDDGLIIATTFASHIERIQMIMDAVEKTGRKPLILGHSMMNHIELAERFNYLDMPPSARVYGTPKAINHALSEIRKNREDYFILATGHQAEPESVLVRMIENKFRFRFEKRDSLVFCASTIPVPLNIANRSVLESKLQSKGVRIFRDVHVSGHASKEDHRRLLDMLKPEHIVPCHGSLDQRSAWAALASEEGYELNKNVHLINNGQSITL